MITFYCPNCWREVPADAHTCPYCHHIYGRLDNRVFADKLINALRHPVPANAATAAQILGNLRDPRAVEPMVEVLTRTRDPEVQEAVIRALGDLCDARAIPALIRVLEDPNAFLKVRIVAAQALGGMDDDDARAALKRTAQRHERSVSVAARTVLENLEAPGPTTN